MQKKGRMGALLCVVTAVAVPATQAQAQEVNARASVSAGASYGTNPFLEVDGGSSASAYVEIKPELQLNNETLDMAIDGTVRYRHFSDRYDPDFMARVGLKAEHKSSERLMLIARAAAQTSRSAVLDAAFADPSILPDDGSLPEFPVIDPSEAGRAGRISGISGSAAADYSLTPVSMLSAEISSAFRFFDRVAADYRTFAISLGYSRNLSETLGISAHVALMDVDYSGRKIGDATVISPSMGINLKVSPTATLEGTLGVDVRQEQLNATLQRSFVTFAGSLAYCDRQLSGSVCLSAQRSTQPTGFDGVSNLTSAALGYSKKVGLYDSISVTVNGSWLDQNRTNLTDNTINDTYLLAGTATWRRQIGDRASVFVTPSVAKLWKQRNERGLI